MMDFNLVVYREYLNLIARNYEYCTFSEYILNKDKKSFCMVRHDVDRKPKNALKMAKLEFEMGVVSTYYFRIKKCSFNRSIVEKIRDLGHEVGYHYEELCDAGGDLEVAINNFEANVQKLKNYADIKTVSSHGRPLSKYDSRDMWTDKSKKERLFDKLGLVGEVYLDIDYSRIAYINDTGRNWMSSKSNLRDKVNSEIDVNFKGQVELRKALSSDCYENIVFQIHPERWSDSKMEGFAQWLKDSFLNIAKGAIGFKRGIKFD